MLLKYSCYAQSFRHVIILHIFSWGYSQTLVLNEGNWRGYSQFLIVNSLEIYRGIFATVCQSDWKVQLTRDAILPERRKVILHDSSCFWMNERMTWKIMLDVCIVENPTDNDLSLQCNWNWVNQRNWHFAFTKSSSQFWKHMFLATITTLTTTISICICSSCIHIMILDKAASIWLFAMFSSVVVC